MRAARLRTADEGFILAGREQHYRPASGGLIGQQIHAFERGVKEAGTATSLYSLDGGCDFLLIVGEVLYRVDLVTETNYRESGIFGRIVYQRGRGCLNILELVKGAVAGIEDKHKVNGTVGFAYCGLVRPAI